MGGGVAYVVELDDGLRVRLALDDWERLGPYRGQRIFVRLPGKQDVWLIVTNVTELPPIVWVFMVRRARAEHGGYTACSRTNASTNAANVTAAASRWGVSGDW
jgi:hypothetical protein